MSFRSAIVPVFPAFLLIHQQFFQFEFVNAEAGNFQDFAPRYTGQEISAMRSMM